MREWFEALSETEYDQLKKSVALVTVLIAGADGTIDAKETMWAKKITEIRSFNFPKNLNGFYKDVGVDFADVLDNIISTYPENVVARQSKISLELEELNDIFTKLENFQGAAVYKSLLTFAKHVAKASGGFLGYFSIDSDEKKWIMLPMINEIIADDEGRII